jgi:hypothetical protein
MEQIILNKQPQNIEFSYETMCHTKISPEEYEICIAIPQSKKYIGYITLVQPQIEQSTLVPVPVPVSVPFYPIMIIYELNRFRKISNIHSIATVTQSFCEIAGWMDETIFYGSIVNEFFILEDLLYFTGISMRNALYTEKVKKMVEIISLTKQFEYLSAQEPITLKLTLPSIFKTPTTATAIQTQIKEVPYPTHHIQYRCISKLKPILNTNIARNGLPTTVTNDGDDKPVSQKHNTTPPRPIGMGFSQSLQFNKPQYKKRTVFEVTAECQYDVYYLYAEGNGGRVFVDVAFISNYETSKMMNRIFRKIKENDNLDYIEESDDEDDFENTQMDKYVDLTKRVCMECQFHYKFKKWVPLRVVDCGGEIVSASNL